MPKTLSYDRKNFLSFDSLLELYNSWLNQPLLISSSPTFENLEVSNELTINGIPVVSSQWEEDGTSIYYNTGNVGIGTTNPVYNLDVLGDINFTADLYKNGVLFSGSQWITSGSNIYYTTGNIGIGTTNPSYNLDVNGNSLFRNGNGGTSFTNSQLLFGYSGTNQYIHNIKTRHNNAGDDSTNAFDFYVWQTSDSSTAIGTKHVMTVSSVGVGIGVTNPKYNFDISSKGLFRGGNSFNNFSNSQILFGYNGNDDYIHNIKTRHNTADDSTNAFDFYVWQTSDATKAIGTKHIMTVSSGGVGIGRTNPTYDLDITGDVNFTGDLYKNGVLFSSGQWTTSGSNIYYNTGNVGIGTNNPLDKFEIYNGDARLIKTTLTDGAYFSVQNQDFSKLLEIGFNDDSLDNGSSYVASSNNDLVLRAGFADRIRIKSTGNIGIGMTNPAYDLDVSGDINFSGILYQNGAPFAGSSQWQNDVNGIYYPALGTFNVGIGTNSQTSYKLHVDGDINFTQQLRKNGTELVLVDIPISTTISPISNFSGSMFNISNEKYFKLENVSASKVYTLNILIPQSNITTGSTTTTFEFDIPNTSAFTNTYDATFNITGYTTDGSDNVLVNLENCMGYCKKTETKGICSFTSSNTTDIHILQITVYY